MGNTNGKTEGDRFSILHALLGSLPEATGGGDDKERKVTECNIKSLTWRQNMEGGVDEERAFQILLPLVGSL